MSEPILAHRQLIGIDILHRDLSLNNLALAPLPTSSPPASNAMSANNSNQTSASSALPTGVTSLQPQHRRGTILDFDCALWLMKKRKVSDRDRTVSQLQIFKAMSETCVTGHDSVYVN